MRVLHDSLQGSAHQGKDERGDGAFMFFNDPDLNYPPCLIVIHCSGPELGCFGSRPSGSLPLCLCPVLFIMKSLVISLMLFLNALSLFVCLSLSLSVCLPLSLFPFPQYLYPY